LFILTFPKCTAGEWENQKALPVLTFIIGSPTGSA